MARQNALRSIQGETNLAQRIKNEREYRGWSYEALAKRLTDAGCSINGSAIFRIEKGDPPRRIAVDELIALAKVFETSIEDLLTPVELLRKARGKEIVAEIDQATDDFIRALGAMMNGYCAYFDLCAYDPEMREYIDNLRFNHRVAEDAVPRNLASLFSVDVDGEAVDFDDQRLRAALVEVHLAVINVAGDVADLAIDKNKSRGREES